MNNKKYRCPNGCDLPPRKKVLIKTSNNTYGYEYFNPTFCPNCGALMPDSEAKLKGFFDVYDIHPSLKKSQDLLYKSEFESAVREAVVTLETALKSKSGLDSFGVDLATKSLSFTYDKQTDTITKMPLIAINDLKTISDRNEQEGIKHMLEGLFQAPRNLYQHNHIGSAVSNSISIILQISFILHIIDGHSITKNAHWERQSIDLLEIYNHMPKKIDRCRFKRMIKERSK